MAPPKLPLNAEVYDWLSYNETTGEFRWKRNLSNKKVGDMAGCLDVSTGYIVIGFNGKLHYAHRLAMYICMGISPDMVDHINGVRTDNRICNLRASDNSKNQANRRAASGKSSPFKGVSRFRNRWRATIKNRHLGVFGNEAAAALAYDKAAQKEFGEHALINFPGGNEHE